MSFGPDGVVYQLALSFNDVAPPFTAFDFDHALLASKSTDGGLTWSDPEVVIRDLDANVFNDKQTITADPTDADLVYAVWDRLVFPTSERAECDRELHHSAFRGPAWFARSTDGGESWEPARQIYDPGQNDQTIGNQIVVLPDGTLVNIFDEIHNDNSKKQRGSASASCARRDKVSHVVGAGLHRSARARSSSPIPSPATTCAPATSSRTSPWRRTAISMRSGRTLA